MREKCIGYRALSCRPIEEGSLGIKNLKVFNESLLGKWVCKIRNERSSLWYRALSCRYGGNEGHMYIGKGDISMW